VSDPSHSSDCTGDLTYKVGASSVSSDYEMLRAQATRELQRRKVPPEIANAIRRTVQLALVVLLVSPLSLWFAWLFVRSATGDLMLRDNSYVLFGWGVLAVGLAVLILISGQGRGMFGLRKAGLTVVLLATIAFSIGYAQRALQAHAHAIASVPDRSFVLSSRRSSTTVHQRADGTIIETGERAPPVPYGYHCEVVQRLDGDFGFMWIRVLVRSQRPSREVAFPIRREDCFGNKPVSTLHG